MKANQLNAGRIKAALRKPGVHVDGAGLLLVVRNGGTARWAVRLMVKGRRRDIPVGEYPRVGLAAARERAAEIRAIARVGGDPTRDTLAPTFERALDAVLDIQRPAWTDPAEVEASWRRSLRLHAAPLMSRPVDEIDAAAVLACVAPIWTSARPTARRVRQRIASVLDWAVASGHIPFNPVPSIKAALPRGGARTVHHPAVPYERVGAVLRAVEQVRAWWASRAALRFLVLTAGRSVEVRGARWDEIDMDARTWTIPADRMKAGREHRVPLSEPAMDVLRLADGLRDGSGLVFPGRSGRPMVAITLRRVLTEAGAGDGTIHGFRSSFRDWAAECTATPHAVMEQALAHTIPNQAEAAYARSDLLAKRRVLMDEWAAFVAD